MYPGAHRIVSLYHLDLKKKKRTATITHFELLISVMLIYKNFQVHGFMQG